MSEPFLSEIRIMGFNFAPRGWASCDGQILPINQNQSLYSLLGTTYGGDGRTSFALPDLRGRTPLHQGSGYQLGTKSGAELHTLSTAEIPTHNHTLSAVSATNNPTPVPSGTVMLGNSPSQLYTSGTPDTTLRAESISSFGGGQAHENMQPYTTLNFCIALQGVFPSRN